MQPLKQAATMATLDLASSFTNGNWALPHGSQALLLFLQKDGGEQRQRPKPHNGRRAHQLIVVQAELLFAIAEEHLDVPTSRDMREQRLGVCLHIAGGPVPRLGERGVQRVAYDHDLTAIERAHAGGHDMDVDRLCAAWPACLHTVLRSHIRQRVAELLPDPPLGDALVRDAQPAIALEARRDEKIPFAGGLPQTFGAIPTLQQNMRYRACHRLTRANERVHQLDLALERLLFHFAHAFLTVHLRSQGDTSDPAPRRVLAPGCGH